MLSPLVNKLPVVHTVCSVCKVPHMEISRLSRKVVTMTVPTPHLLTMRIQIFLYLFWHPLYNGTSTCLLSTANRFRNFINRVLITSAIFNSLYHSRSHINFTLWKYDQWYFLIKFLWNYNSPSLSWFSSFCI